jgi:hypothetical protein
MVCEQPFNKDTSQNPFNESGAGRETPAFVAVFFSEGWPPEEVSIRLQLGLL